MLKSHSRMISDKKLLETHIKLGVKALNIYDRCPKIESGNIRAANLSKLQDSINVSPKSAITKLISPFLERT